MAAVPLHILEIEATAVTAEVLVNDVAIHRSGARETISAASHLNGWAQPGRNNLSVRLANLPGPPPEAAPEPAFTLRLRRAVPGTPNEADQVLAEYTWAPAQPLGLALAQVFSTDPAMQAAQAWSWTRGYAFTSLNAGDRAGLASLLRRLRNALAERSIDEVVDLQRVQVGEQAIANGTPAAEMLERYASFLRDRMGPADWRAEPFDEAGLRTELMADGRVVHVTTAGGGPPIVTRSSDGLFAIDPYLSKIDGRWTIVR